MTRKSTMVEFVDELKQLLERFSPLSKEHEGLSFMIVEALAGEFHDYKNKKYVCGKVAASSMLRQLGFIPLAKRIEDGEFDEVADEDDRAMLRSDALAGGFSEQQIEKLFKL